MGAVFRADRGETVAALPETGRTFLEKSASFLAPFDRKPPQKICIKYYWMPSFFAYDVGQTRPVFQKRVPDFLSTRDGFRDVARENDDGYAIVGGGGAFFSRRGRVAREGRLACGSGGVNLTHLTGAGSVQRASKMLPTTDGEHKSERRGYTGLP